MANLSNVPLMFQPLVKYVQFEGRSRRSEFWLWVLFMIIVGMVLNTVVFASFGPMFARMSTSPAAVGANPMAFMGSYFTVAPVVQLVNVALILPSLAVGVRRLHDINRSGWWIILPYAVAFIGFIVFMIFFGGSLINLASAHGDLNNVPEAEGMKFAFQLIGALFLCLLLPCLIADIVMLIFFVTEGTRGPNRFGPDPKAVISIAPGIISDPV